MRQIKSFKKYLLNQGILKALVICSGNEFVENNQP